MNKNPRRPKDMNKILSQLLNPKDKPETFAERNRRIKKEIEDLVFNY